MVTNSRIPRLIKHWIQLDNHIKIIIRYRIDIGTQIQCLPINLLRHLKPSQLNADHRFAWAKIQGIYWKTNILTSNSVLDFQFKTSSAFAYEIRQKNSDVNYTYTELGNKNIKKCCISILLHFQCTANNHFHNFN